MELLQTIQPWQNPNEIFNRLDLLWKNNILDLRVNIKTCSEKEHFDELFDFINKVIKINNDVRFYIDIGYPFDSFRIKIKHPYLLELVAHQNIHLSTSNGIRQNIFYEKEIFLRDRVKHLNLNVKDQIVYGDGSMNFMVCAIMETGFLLEAQNTGRIWDGKAIHLPSQSLKPCMNLNFILSYLNKIPEKNLEGVICSFVDNKNQVIELKKRISTKVISKIETKKGIDQLNEISNISDIVMLGRGDLYFNTASPTQYVECQYKFLNYIKQSGVRSIIATNILDSFAHTRIPKRDEITDLWNILEYCPSYLCLSSDLLYGSDYEEGILFIQELFNLKKRFIL